MQPHPVIIKTFQMGAQRWETILEPAELNPISNQGVLTATYHIYGAVGTYLYGTVPTDKDYLTTTRVGGERVEVPA